MEYMLSIKQLFMQEKRCERHKSKIVKKAVSDTAIRDFELLHRKFTK